MKDSVTFIQCQTDCLIAIALLKPVKHGSEVFLYSVVFVLYNDDTACVWPVEPGCSSCWSESRYDPHET